MASPARATITDLERVCNIESWLDDFSSTEKQAALDASSDLADGYLSVRYTLPITAYGKDLIRCECWLAAKELLVGKGFAPESARDKQIIDRAAEALQWLKDIAAMLSPGQPIYVILYSVAIVFFCFFYTALVFNSRETADNLKKSGAFIPGIRPGDQTAKYIDRILSRLTLAGAVYITAVCLLPEFLVLKYNVPFYFGGTSLLIIVVVTMDFWAQVQSYVMSQQYESLLKKANFKAS